QGEGLLRIKTSKNMLKKLAIFGLGNPGEKYTNTRHNTGSSFLNFLASLNECEWSDEREFESEICEIVFNNLKLILVKPVYFMNNSGQAVSKVMNYFDIPKEDILIIHDDLDIPFGTIRFSKDSGSAGHNGIKSIIKHLGTQDFIRLRVGISNRTYLIQNIIPPEKFVLGRFNSEEKTALENLFQEISKAVNFYIENGFEETKNKYNKSAMPLIGLG
nr:aminoacyl-tRNA hydrolase [Patescibacteria group bacterium]